MGSSGYYAAPEALSEVFRISTRTVTGCDVPKSGPMASLICIRGLPCIALLLLIGALGSGCIPTPYQRDGTGGGYAEFKMAADTYRVTFTGNRSTPHRKILNYLSYRCAELTLVQGYNSFVFTEKLLVAADGSVEYLNWSNGGATSPFAVTPVGGGGLVGGLAGALAKGALKGALGGGGYRSQQPNGYSPNEPTGGVAQAVIRMFERPDGEVPQLTNFSEGVVYDARGVMRILQKFDGDLSVMESNRLTYGDRLYHRDPTPGMEIKRQTYQQQLEESRTRPTN